MKDILRELLKTFKFYGQQAIDEYISARFSDQCLSDIPVPSNFYGGFGCSEAPLYSADSTMVITSETAQTAGCLIHSPIADANVYLHKWLKNDCEQVPEQALTFFSLPPEIRNCIYERVCTFGWPGLLVRPEGFRVTRRKTSEDMLGEEVENLRAPPVQTLLELLLVNRQMYDEALPIFYGRNWFKFDTPYEFYKFIKGSADERVQLLRQVIITCDTTFRGIKGYELGAKALSTFTKLQSLEVIIHDKSWFDRELIRKVYGAENYSHPRELPGIQNLAYALNNAARFKIFGSCPQIRAYLATEIAKLKTAGMKGEVEKLRRAEQLREARSFKEIDKKRDSEEEPKSTTSSRSGIGEESNSGFFGRDRSKVFGASARSDSGNVYGDRSSNQKRRSGRSASGMSDSARESSTGGGSSTRVWETKLDEFDPELDGIEESNDRNTSGGKEPNDRNSADEKKLNDHKAGGRRRPSTRSTTSDPGSGGSDGRPSKRRKGNDGRH